MSRYIDADKLKIAIDKEIFRHDTIDHVFQIIDDAPTVDAVSEWIPCSERLPNNDEEAIVSVEDDRADNIFKYTTTAWKYGDVWVSDNERICGIIAWMPLPKPYEETKK